MKKNVIFLLFLFLTHICAVSQYKKVVINVKNEEFEEVNTAEIISSLKYKLVQNNSAGPYYLDNINDSVNNIQIAIYKQGYNFVEYNLSLNDSVNLFNFTLTKNIVLNDIVIDYNKPLVESNKITYRIDTNMLLENSDVNDALKVIPFVFQKFENNSYKYYYNNKEITLAINGDINNNFTIPDARLIDKVEFFPFGNSYLKAGNSPILNIILKVKEKSRKENITLKTAPLLNDNMIFYNLLYKRNKILLSLPVNLFNTKYNNDFKKSNNFNTEQNEDLKQKNKEFYISVRPTLDIKFNNSNSLITTVSMDIGERRNNQENLNKTAVLYSKDFSKQSNSFISSTYRYNFGDKIISLRGFWKNSTDDYHWNNDIIYLASKSTRKIYLGDFSIQQTNVNWNSFSLDYRFGYSISYNDNVIIKDTSKYNVYTFSNIIYAGAVLRLTDMLSLDTYFSYNLVKRTSDSNNFLRPNITLNYRFKDDYVVSVSYKNDYILPDIKKVNEYEEYDLNNNLIKGSRLLKGFSKNTYSASFSGVINTINYSFHADYQISKDEIINAPSFDNGRLLFEYKNSVYDFYKTNIGVNLSKNFLDKKLLLQLQASINYQRLMYENNSIKPTYLSYQLYLRWRMTKKSSIELNSYWDSNRREIFKSYYDNYPMISLAYSKNIIKNMNLRVEGYSPLIKNKQTFFIDNYIEKAESTSSNLNNLKFISIQLRYTFGNKKISNINSSSDQINYEN